MLYISHLEQAVKYEYLLIFYKCTLLNVKINIVLHYIYINWVWWRFIQQRVRAWENTSAACSLHSLLLQQSDTANSIPATVLFCHCVTLVTLHNSNSVVHVSNCKCDNIDHWRSFALYVVCFSAFLIFLISDLFAGYWVHGNHNAMDPWNNGNEVHGWGVAEIQKMSPSTTGRCK